MLFLAFLREYYLTGQVSIRSGSSVVDYNLYNLYNQSTKYYAGIIFFERLSKILTDTKNVNIDCG